MRTSEFVIHQSLRNPELYACALQIFNQSVTQESRALRMRTLEFLINQSLRNNKFNTNILNFRQ